MKNGRKDITMIEQINKMVQDNKTTIKIIQDQIKQCDCNEGYRESKHRIFDTIRTICRCQYHKNNYGKMIHDYEKDIIRLNNAINYIDRLPEEYKKVFYDNEKMETFLKSDKINNFFTDKSHKKILFISGPVGIGKTTMLFYLAARSMIMKMDISIYRESNFKIEYGKMITPSFFPYFMIDDLRGTSHHYSNYYYTLFDKIRRSEGKVAFTCNYDVETWAGRFENKDDGVRTYDRSKLIIEEIKLFGKSRR
jgi:DNA replication protein DnaC